MRWLLVNARQSGLEHRCPTRDARTLLTASEKSSPIGDIQLLGTRCPFSCVGHRASIFRMIFFCGCDCF